jgi:hypothetical protein
MCGKRVSLLLGDSEPTAHDLEEAERRLRSRLHGVKPSNYVPAWPEGNVEPTPAPVVDTSESLPRAYPFVYEPDGNILRRKPRR